MTDAHAPAALVRADDGGGAVHPLVRAALDHASLLDAGTLRDLLAIQRDWAAGEAKRHYARALVALKRDLPTTIARDKLVDFGTARGRTTYTHASLAAVIDAVTPHLTSHGFALSFHPATTERTVRVVARLTHVDGHSEECMLEAPFDASGSKSQSQGIGSTITILERYGALSLLGIATADMHDPAPAVDDAERVDPDRNLRAVGAVVRAGRTREAAEERIGRAVESWTRADLDTLRAWLAAEAAG